MTMERVLHGITLGLLLVVSFHVGERMILIAAGLTIAYMQWDVTGWIPVLDIAGKGISLMLAWGITAWAYRYLEEARAVVPYE